ncbi:MAG: VOC family protein [Spirulina sp. SIO3F2]|nr:VOC family protein [Spirulina sp. SIO3F2]
MHHVSIRTADIHAAIAFYEQLGFAIAERFTTGYTLACWLEGFGGRLELMQIPEPDPAPDPFGDEHYVGYYHFTLDLTTVAESLPSWLNAKKTEYEVNNQSLKVLLEPKQQMIGNRVYEVAFIADTDGLPIELLRQLT